MRVTATVFRPGAGDHQGGVAVLAGRAKVDTKSDIAEPASANAEVKSNLAVADAVLAGRANVDTKSDIAETDSDGEEVCTIPDGAKLNNKYYMRRVRRTIGDETFSGTIVDVGRGSISGTLLYTLQYDDKDEEHLDEDQISLCRLLVKKGKGTGKSKGK